MALYQHTVKAILECNQIEYSFDTDTYLIDNAGSLSQDSKDHLREDKLTLENLDFMRRKDFKYDALTRHIIASVGIPYEILRTHGFYEETLVFKN